MNPVSRKTFLTHASQGLGGIALASLLQPRASGVNPFTPVTPPRETQRPHFNPKARRILWLTQSGAPSQLDLFDPKPGLATLFNQDLPPSVRGEQRLTGMTAGQKRFPIAPSLFRFRPHGQCGMSLSELLPHTAKWADELCLIRSMHTEAINHDPAMTLLQTGHQIGGRPSFGAWVSYGLGSENDNLPTFVALVSTPSGNVNSQPLHERMWGAGFLPARTLGEYHDPETRNRIDQFEMAFRMQAAVPELADLSSESARTFDLYGPESRKPGTYAANCLMARRLAERGVRFIQLYHRGWDQHGNLPRDIRSQCYDTDQPTAALLAELKERGLLEDTLVIWGGEFGRTTYSQGTLTQDNYGRDHHPRCFSVWMAGAGIQKGHVHGETDDFSYNIVRDPVHIHDLNATALHLLGIEHTRLTHRFQGRDYRLTDVHGEIVKGVLA
jgi:hypothetical protein